MAKNIHGTTALPFSMQIELVYGCNRRCWFCGIHDTPKDDIKYMSLGLVRAVGEECNIWKPRMRMEFGTGGEATLHPQFLSAIEILRITCPDMQIMLQTNTEVWATSESAVLLWIDNWFSAGGNILVLNCYKKGLKNKFETWLSAVPWEIVDFYDDNPKHYSMYHYKGPDLQRIFLCDDLGQMTLTKRTGKVSQRWLNNQGGSVLPKSMERAGIPVLREPLKKKCTVPFRQMVLSWDGKVPLCCYDWIDRFVAGKFPEQSLQEIWNGRPFQVARELLYRKNRNNHPCKTCDYFGGFRVGLLNNPMLKGSTETLEKEMLDHITAGANTWDSSQVEAVLRMEREQK